MTGSWQCSIHAWRLLLVTLGNSCSLMHSPLRRTCSEENKSYRPTHSVVVLCLRCDAALFSRVDMQHDFCSRIAHVEVTAYFPVRSYFVLGTWVAYPLVIFAKQLCFMHYSVLTPLTLTYSAHSREREEMQDSNDSLGTFLL